MAIDRIYTGVAEGLPEVGLLSPQDLLRNLQGGDESGNGLTNTWTATIAWWRCEPQAGRATAKALLALFHSVQNSFEAGRDPAARAYNRIDTDFQRGLEQRVGQYIEPAGDLEPIPSDDPFYGVLTGLATERTRAEIWAYRFVDELRDWAWRLATGTVETGIVAGKVEKVLRPAGARAPLPNNIAICDRCTVIFKPARKKRAKRCPACSKRAPVGPALFVVRPRRNLGEWLPGASIPLRVAEVAPDGQLEAWRGRHVVRCAECNGFFVAAHRRAGVCSASCEQKRRRRAA